MSQRIKISILNSKNRKQIVSILRKNLGNYTKTKYIFKNRIVWAKPENLKKIFSRKNIGIKETKGMTDITGKSYARYEFNLWRRHIIDDKDLDNLMIALKKRYDKIKNRHKLLQAQRIGITIGTADKNKKVFFNAVTRRKKSREVVDVISTQSYERHPSSVDPMFLELKEKIRSVFFDKKGYSLDIKDDAIIQALKFFVFFTEV